jgi:hypothetical protein
VLQNTQCIVDVGASSAAIAANRYTLNLSMTFKAAYGGNKYSYGYAATTGGLNSGWQALGVWNTAGAAAVITSPPLRFVPVTPCRAWVVLIFSPEPSPRRISGLSTIAVLRVFLPERTPAPRGSALDQAKRKSARGALWVE